MTTEKVQIGVELTMLLNRSRQGAGALTLLEIARILSDVLEKGEVEVVIENLKKINEL
jgi:hypothetical protein